MPLLTTKPSDLVRGSRMYFSVEAEETMLPQTIDYLGRDHFVYASDIPHWDNGFPENLHKLKEHPALSDDVKEKILYSSAKALFDL